MYVVLSPDYWIRKHVMEIFLFHLFLGTYIVYSWMCEPWIITNHWYTVNCFQGFTIINNFATNTSASTSLILDGLIFLGWIPESRLRGSETCCWPAPWKGAILIWCSAQGQVGLKTAPHPTGPAGNGMCPRKAAWPFLKHSTTWQTRPWCPLAAWEGGPLLQ